jgi:2-polyprenyl-3-methyl-5-hydroxy-6-metoxy-1,4-benzoquinol methylase
MLCPICHSPLTSPFACKNGHSFQLNNGIPSLLKPDFKERLDVFTDKLTKFRDQEGNRVIKQQLFDELPFARDLPLPHLWEVKQHDLKFIKKFLSGKKNLRILDVGAMNGWLSNHLSKSGHSVWAIDYLVDEYDGLGAHRHYTNQEWNPIQVNLNELDILNDERFDLIIVNRVSIFFTDPHSTFDYLKKLLTDEGTLLITGVQIFKNWQKEKLRIETMKKTFLEKNGFEMFMFPIKGYFNKTDLEELKRSGFQIILFPGRWKNRVKKFLLPGAMFNCIAIYSSDK